MKYRKKPVVIEALQWTGDNIKEVKDFCSTESITPLANRLMIVTLEEIVYASLGDYIIKGVHGEFYPCKPNIFAETYELVGEEQ